MKEQTDIARRASEIFERIVRPRVDIERDARKYVAIDVETEDFEIDANQRAATDRLLERQPEARQRMWLRRVGSRFAHRFGGGRMQDENRS